MEAVQRGGTFAFIVTLSNRIAVVSINPINQRLFFVPDLGMFQMDQSYRYIMGRSEVFLYHQLSTNPLSLGAIVELTNYLNNLKLNRLDMHDLAIYVEKIRKVEQSKKLIDGLLSTASDEEGIEAVKKYLQQVFNDGSLQYSIEKLADLSKPKDKALSDHFTDWLNAYYSEDIVSRHFVMLSMIIQEKPYRMKTSYAPNMGFNISLKAAGKRNIAMIVINDAIIEPDFNATVEINEDTGIQELHTSKFGTFQIREAKTRYRYGKKQNVYFVMVRTKTPATTKPRAEDDRQIEVTKDQLAPQPEEAPQPIVKAKAGRKPKPVMPEGDPVEGIPRQPHGLIEHDVLKGYYYDPKKPQIIYQAEFIAAEIKQKGRVEL